LGQSFGQGGDTSWELRLVVELALFLVHAGIRQAHAVLDFQQIHRRR
jgi:hypothetical protein